MSRKAAMKVEEEGTKGKDPLDRGFLSSLDDPLRSIVQRLLQPDENGGSTDPSVRVDQFEIDLRQQALEKVRAFLTAASDASSMMEGCDELGSFWVHALRVCLHLVHFTKEDGDETATESTALGNGPVYDSKLAIRRQLPIILLDDILDTLPITACCNLWQDHVVPAYPLLFGDDLWQRKSSWLPLLKVANALLRRPNLPTNQAAALMQTMARIYPLQEKSAIKVWGSHNVDNVTDFESNEEFLQQQQEQQNTAESTTDYSFYESFWKLQRDFQNPYTLSVADFLQRLGAFLSALESHSTKPPTTCTMSSSSSSSTTKQPNQRHTQKYLTSSRVLALQLQDADFRMHVLTQFLLMAHHLTSQVASLGPRLLEYRNRAQHLLKQQAGGPEHLALVESCLATLEPQWRQWKQNKCQPDLETKRAVAGKKRPRTETTRTTSTAQSSSSLSNKRPLLKDLPSSQTSCLEDHLQDYVEALDPESGIEAQYHPKNNKLFLWRALRLMAADHLPDFDKIGPNGDLEPAVRFVYQNDKGIDIPGEAPVYDEAESEEDDDDQKEKAVEEGESEAAEEQPAVDEDVMEDQGENDNDATFSQEAMEVEKREDGESAAVNGGAAGEEETPMDVKEVAAAKETNESGDVTNAQSDAGAEDTSTEKDTSAVKEVPTSSIKTEDTKAVEKTENGAKADSSVDETNDGKPQTESVTRSESSKPPPPAQRPATKSSEPAGDLRGRGGRQQDDRRTQDNRLGGGASRDVARTDDPRRGPPPRRPDDRRPENDGRRGDSRRDGRGGGRGPNDDHRRGPRGDAGRGNDGRDRRGGGRRSGGGDRRGSDHGRRDNDGGRRGDSDGRRDDRRGGRRHRR